MNDDDEMLTATLEEARLLLRVQDLLQIGFGVSEISRALSEPPKHVNAAIRVLYARQQLADALTAYNDSLRLLRDTEF